MDVNENSTSGNLTVTGMNTCGPGPTSSAFPIMVKNTPSDKGIINGPQEVCSTSSDAIYQVVGVKDASKYKWEYSGFNGTIFENSNSLAINFNENYSNGILKVTGSNSCGTSSVSAELAIDIKRLPSAPLINGDHQVCVNDQVTLNINPNDNTAYYQWHYRGNGNIIYENGNEINIEVRHLGDAGKLTARGINSCGSGEYAEPFTIYADLCNLHIPNTFTPNNDGINDDFVIKRLPENTHLIIFDRAGKTIFETENYQNNWDGRNMSGERLLTDTYWYVLSIEGIASKYKGAIYLKR